MQPPASGEIAAEDGMARWFWDFSFFLNIISTEKRRRSSLGRMAAAGAWPLQIPSASHHPLQLGHSTESRMSSLKRGGADGGVAIKAEECGSDIDIVRSMRDIAEAHYSYRDAPPAHYTLKIDSFSKVLGAIQCYTSEIFESGGYKWQLSLYPKGDEERNGKGHISMYLRIEDTEALPTGWEVNVVYKFFILDQIRYKFLAIEDALRRTARFSATKSEWGISKLLPYSDFGDIRSGFLMKDMCVFGAEIFIIPCTSVGECISPVKDFVDYTYTWKIHPFSSFTSEFHDSEVFTAGNFKWKLKFYPRGNKLEKNKSLSVYLKAVGLVAQAKVYAEYKICIQDQSGAKHQENKASVWFSCTLEDWGFGKIISLDDLNNPSNGFLVKDTVVIEAHISNIFSLKKGSVF